MTQSITGCLKAFVDQLRAYLRTDQGAVSVRADDLAYVQPYVKNFNYDPLRGLSVSMSYQQIPYPYVFVKRDLLHKFASIYPIVFDCIEKISIRTEMPTDEAWQELSGFADAVAIAHFTQPNQEVPVELITDFLDLIDRGQIDWDIVSGLAGVGLVANDIRLIDGYTLRRPIVDDFQRLMLEAEVLMRPQSMPPSAILVGRERTADLQQVMARANALIMALRLLGLGSVAEVMHWTKPIGPITGKRFGVGHSMHEPSIRYRYAIKDGVEETIKNFIDAIWSPLRQAMHPFAGEGGEKPLNIAIERFNAAVLNSGQPEEIITQSISCLESLLLKANERSELSHRLAERVARALRGLSGAHDAPTKVYQDVSHAYDIRSRYIHGAFVTSEEVEKARKLGTAILDHARKLIVMFLRLAPTIDKERLIGLIDKALLDERKSSELDKILATVNLAEEAVINDSPKGD